MHELVTHIFLHAPFLFRETKGAMSFATTTLVLSLYNLGVQGITIPNAVLTFSLAYGGSTQFLAGLWEFASGNTLGASIFVSFGCFWWGFSMIFVPFFGETGMYNNQPGVYNQMGGAAAMEFENAVGLYLWIWFGITTIFLIGSIRSSIALAFLLFVLDLTFAMLGAFYYTGNAKFETAGEFLFAPSPDSSKTLS
jgi:succinate-acetate transporter protein